MELTKEQAKENLSRLTAKFERELSVDRIKEYNEEAAKIAFIQPLLKDVLGWDVNDHDEVSPEEKTSRGRVDYGLKVEGKIKIFIEAKPPKADLSRHVEQAIQYGYNRKGVSFVLLTDFEGLKLFDVTVKPDIRNPLKGLKIDLSWKNYLTQFEKLWLLSKESVAKGELDKLLLVKPKERLPVDKAILDDLKRWRETLAKDLFKNNPELFHSEDQEKDASYLKEIAQRILDRIIFMRSCEDRGLVHRRPLKELFEERTETVGTNTMIFLKEEFKHYNNIFNSDLFRPQDWENNLAIDFSVIKDIVLETYNPYQFDVIPLEVLGNIYEQYLGYTIRLTDHQVKYELKPEVRKAGGIYYTPEYIVDYIVKNTVGKLLQELPPRKIKKLRILDPACGSGSFLIRAYEEMLNYYLDQKKKKQKEEGKQRKLELEKEEAEPSLTINEKSEILREHIFGVDIDEQAVEVTKLSLMLKMLEGEYGIIPGRAILPMLDKNIKCGNSLISGDILELKKYFGDDWYIVKPFNWDREFREIVVEEGGFDVIIGNPPYGALLNKLEKDYLFEKYPLIKGQPDSYEYFLYQAKNLSLKKGYMSFIVPTNFIESQRAEGLREALLREGYIKLISSFRYNVWAQNAAETLVIVFQKGVKGDVSYVIHPRSPYEFINEINTVQVDQASWLKTPLKRFLIRANPTLIQKIEDEKIRLRDVCDVSQGIIVYKTREESIRNPYISDRSKGTEWKKLLDNKSSIKRYALNWGGHYLKYGAWLWCPRDSKYFEQPKILFIRLRNKSLTRKLIGTYDNEKFYNRDNFNNIILKDRRYSLKYILGLFNSTLLNYWYKSYFDNVNINPAQVRLIPICSINFNNFNEKKLYDNLIVLVDVMIDLNKKIQISKGHEKEQIQRQIEKTDREIDDLVYKLYGITEEEKKIIEGGE
jgi:type I restriction-modification system DNA methylase subunit